MSVDWSYYKDERFRRVLNTFLPSSGEGDSKGTQVVTAVNKLIYKWYNDGDVYDNTGALEGWVNDLSSYANWLYKYIPRTRKILDRVFECYDDSDYEDLLRDLAEETLDLEFVEDWSKDDSIGSIYNCNGPFEFKEFDEDEDDDYPYESAYDEDEDDDYPYESAYDEDEEYDEAE